MYNSTEINVLVVNLKMVMKNICELSAKSRVYEVGRSLTAGQGWTNCFNIY